MQEDLASKAIVKAGTSNWGQIPCDEVGLRSIHLWNKSKSEAVFHIVEQLQCH